MNRQISVLIDIGEFFFFMENKHSSKLHYFKILNYM